MSGSNGLLIEVALPLPLFRNFTYAAGDADPSSLHPGSRVLVPLRSGKEIGICVRTGVDAPARGAVKEILSAPTEPPAVTAEVMRLCEWMSDYYAVPLGVALRAALPAALTATDAFTPHRKAMRIVQIRGDIPSLLMRERAFSRAPQQRLLFELLEELGGSAPLGTLRSMLSFSASVLQGLVRRGLVSVTDQELQRDPFAGRGSAAAASHIPSEAQEQAVRTILAGTSGSVFLVHGVTGSGKTLVYIEVLRSILSRGRTGIVLVPEIALTPQTVDRFRGAFGDQVAVLHSALSDGERYDAWLSLRRGDRRIAVGARSAIFAPLENVGVIVVDEEHEGTYKQGESPRYHAREAAIVRARASGGVVVLGSATPALESWRNAQEGKYTLITLPDRVAGSTLPAVRAIDMRTRARGTPGSMAGTNFGSLFSPELEGELEECLERGEQCILLLNRRGHSSFLQCRNCGDVVVCRNCSISLTYHSVPERLVCHYCNHSEEARGKCRQCGGDTVRQRGIGTQQAERLVRERYPSARVARMDVDTTGEKWAHARILDSFGKREIDVLLGTQMIAKGLDFPGITLVGVLDADVGINLPDFRASERSFQLLSQVAGRAGRGKEGGRVLIQTRSPHHHAVRHALSHDFLAFAREELAARQDPLYAPYVRLANLVISGTDEKMTAELAVRSADWLRRLIKGRASGMELVGPAPAPVERIKSRWRWHLLLKAKDGRELTRVLRYFAERFRVPVAGGARVAIDRDPVSLM